jgi:predicted PurR-regulated permease PerM
MREDQNQAVAGMLRIALAIAVGLFLVAVLGRILLVLFAAVLIAIAIGEASDSLALRLGWRRGAALTVVLLAIVLVLGATLWLAGASLATEVDQLTMLLPEAFDSITRWLGQYEWGRYIATHSQSIVEDQYGHLIGLGSLAAGGLLTSFGEFLIALLLGIYLAAEPALYRKGLVRLWPAARRAEATALVEQLEIVLAGWIKAQFVAMVLIGFSVGVGLWIIGLPSAPLLGLITGLVNFIPNLGPIIAGVPTVLLAIPEGDTAVLATLALLTVVQIVEGYLLVPLLEQRLIQLPPAIALVMQLLLGLLAGGLGVAMAAPLAAVAITLVRELYVIPVADKE